MVDVVIAADGNTYSKASLERWFEDEESNGLQIVSPLTGLPMEKGIAANVEMRRALMEFIFKFQHLRAAFGEWRARERSEHPAGRREHETIELTNSKVAATIPGSGSCAITRQDDLGKLREAFTKLDALRDLLKETLEGWDPPSVTVIGTRSAGKSSILERLTMMDLFLRDPSICTRLHIHVRFIPSMCHTPSSRDTLGTNVQTGAFESQVNPLKDLLLPNRFQVKDQAPTFIEENNLRGKPLVVFTRQARDEVNFFDSQDDLISRAGGSRQEATRPPLLCLSVQRRDSDAQAEVGMRLRDSLDMIMQQYLAQVVRPLRATLLAELHRMQTNDLAMDVVATKFDREKAAFSALWRAKLGEIQTFWEAQVNDILTAACQVSRQDGLISFQMLAKSDGILLSMFERKPKTDAYKKMQSGARLQLIEYILSLSRC
ncbi:hypothetical protein CYMTET_16572 [Cymbomonas tetramitiformis]|uniref:Dynamin N-terminal domain-containing protein n=1 Tax=Cymbomonas tetramitiformis TaxID=36881 RepID=A0AAE0GBW7_9CHLO|nr:hypothetical protein CYMTET_16572 [Cymbomonas tetramitiformis]